LSTVFEDAKNICRKPAFRLRLSAVDYCIAVVTAGAAILRIYDLGSKSIWLDESLTAYRAALPLKSLIMVIVHGQMNMSLYYLFMYGWTRVAGSSEFTLRLPWALFDTVTVPLVYTLGAQLWDRRMGLLAALLLTVNANSIEWAQTARSYSLFVMLVVLSSIGFIRTVKHGSAWGSAAYVIAGTSSVYTHLFGIFALPSQGLSLFLFRPGIKKTIRLTLCAFMIAILSVPAFFFAISYDRGNINWVEKTSFSSVIQQFFIYTGALDGQVSRRTVLMFGLFTVSIVCALIRSQRRGWPVVGYLLLSICVPIILAVVTSMVKPMFISRYFLPGLSFFALLTAYGVMRMGRSILATAIVLTIFGLGLSEDYSYYQAQPIQDWRGATKFVADHSERGDIVLVYPEYYRRPIQYYLSRPNHPERFPSMAGLVANFWTKASSVDQVVNGLGIEARRRIWFIFPELDVRGQKGQRALQALVSNRRVTEKSLPGVRIFLLDAAPEASR